MNRFNFLSALFDHIQCVCLCVVFILFVCSIHSEDNRCCSFHEKKKKKDYIIRNVQRKFIIQQYNEGKFE